MFKNGMQNNLCAIKKSLRPTHREHVVSVALWHRVCSIMIMWYHDGKAMRYPIMMMSDPSLRR